MPKLIELAIKQAGLDAKSPDEWPTWGTERQERNNQAFRILRSLACAAPIGEKHLPRSVCGDGSGAQRGGFWTGPDGQSYRPKYCAYRRGTQADARACFWPSCWPPEAEIVTDGWVKFVPGMEDWPMDVEIAEEAA